MRVLLRKFIARSFLAQWIRKYAELLILQKLPMHPEKVTVCCGLRAGGTSGPYFFKDAANRNVTVNDERYREMISNFTQNARD